MRIGRCELVDLDDVADDRAATEDVVVVVDVIRAFTTAVAAIDAGASSVHCVGGLDEARELAGRMTGSFLMGEEGGDRPEGFDAGNSPFDLAGHELLGRAVVQRTSNGTRGLIRFGSVPVLLAAAAVNAGATGRWIRAQDPGSVLIVGTGINPEDPACGAFIAEVVDGGKPEPGELAATIRGTADAHIAWWSQTRNTHDLESFHAEVAACAQVDTSMTVLRGRCEEGAVVLRSTR